MHIRNTRAFMTDFSLHFLTETICPSLRGYRKYSTKGSTDLPAMTRNHSHVDVVYASRFTVNSKRKFSSGRGDAVRELRKRPQIAYFKDS